MAICRSIMLLGALLSLSVSNEARPAGETNQYKYRVPLRVGAAGYNRWDRPVEVELDFSRLLSRCGQTDYVDPANVILLEVNEHGATPVAFQFDRCEEFHPWTDARG
ncbi:MAG: hypothetical protein JSW27_20465, partial [Phycisphaerales bacterium]